MRSKLAMLPRRTKLPLSSPPLVDRATSADARGGGHQQGRQHHTERGQERSTMVALRGDPAATGISGKYPLVTFCTLVHAATTATYTAAIRHLKPPTDSRLAVFRARGRDSTRRTGLPDLYHKTRIRSGTLCSRAYSSGRRRNRERGVQQLPHSDVYNARTVGNLRLKSSNL